MDVPTAMIWCTVISSVFGLLFLELHSRNWFRKKGYENNLAFLKKAQDLQLKKLAKSLDLGTAKNTPSPPPSNAGAAPDTIGTLLGLAKNLNPEQLGAIADIIQGRLAGGDEVVPEGIDGLMGFLEKNPDLVKGFLDGLNKGKEENNPGGIDNDPTLI